MSDRPKVIVTARGIRPYVDGDLELLQREDGEVYGVMGSEPVMRLFQKYIAQLYRDSEEREARAYRRGVADGTATAYERAAEVAEERAEAEYEAAQRSFNDHDLDARDHHRTSAIALEDIARDIRTLASAPQEADGPPPSSSGPSRARKT